MGVTTLQGTSSRHCTNLKENRRVGSYWEKQFGIMAGAYGKSFSFMQIGKSGAAVVYAKNRKRWNKHTAPDLTVWTAPGEHHEIKHKNPFLRNNVRVYGLEVYRFNALLWFAQETGQNVMYTIHDHDLAGGRDVKENNIAHWVTANILHLNQRWADQFDCSTWYNGEKKVKPTYIWAADLWTPLETFWRLV